jgi:hypothetical protein
MYRKQKMSGKLDVDSATARIEWAVPNGLSATVQYAGIGSVIGTAIVTLYRSNDGVNWVEFPTPGLTLVPGTPMSDPFNISEVMHVAAVTTTEEGSALLADVTMCVVGD